MTEKQKKLLEKEFKINDDFSISRSDYENLPCPMHAWEWKDDKMKELAKRISIALEDFKHFNKEIKSEHFWRLMESEALLMGMMYYEDFHDTDIDEIEFRWNQLK